MWTANALCDIVGSGRWSSTLLLLGGRDRRSGTGNYK
jgi:hypothetical protein